MSEKTRILFSITFDEELETVVERDALGLSVPAVGQRHANHPERFERHGFIVADGALKKL